MSDYLVKKNDKPAIYSSERCQIVELLNDPAVPQVSLARTRVDPGVTTELHVLTVDEWYLVESGSGLMEVAGDEPFSVGPGDAVVIPAGESQCIANNGTDELVFQCICIPRFTRDCYRSVE